MTLTVIKERVLTLKVIFTFWMIAVDMKNWRVDHLPYVRTIER